MEDQVEIEEEDLGMLFSAIQTWIWSSFLKI